MSINLQKGQKIDLTKGGSASGLKHIMVALGWDEAEKPKGVLGGLFGKKGFEFDCDASALLCDNGGHYKDMVYYGNLQLPDGSVVHQGDNLVGGSGGDDEQIMVDLSKLNPEYGKIVFVVNIFDAKEREQHFGMIRNAYIRLVDLDNNNEICRFNLSENYNGMEGLIVGEIYKHNNEWKFNAVGQPVQKCSKVLDFTAYYR